MKIVRFWRRTVKALPTKMIIESHMYRELAIVYAKKAGFALAEDAKDWSFAYRSSSNLSRGGAGDPDCGSRPPPLPRFGKASDERELRQKKFGAGASARTPHPDRAAPEARKRGVQGEREKTTAPRIPMWSPTMVLTGRHSG
jgi:hypothetical protein